MKNEKIIAFRLLFSVFLLLFVITYTSAIEGCYDSDGGKNYFTYGSVKDKSGNTFYDDCAPDAPGWIKEYYCLPDGYAIISRYKCPKGCLEGVCKSDIKRTTTTTTIPNLQNTTTTTTFTTTTTTLYLLCYDSDYGENYYLKGYVKDKRGNYFYDKCLSDYKLREYYCSGVGYAYSKKYECQNGCTEGKCKLPAPAVEVPASTTEISPNITSCSFNQTNALKGSTVKLNSNITEGNSPLDFVWWLFNGSVLNLTGNNTFSWWTIINTSSLLGNYTNITSFVNDTGSNMDSETCGYLNVFTTTSTTTTTTIPAGEDECFKYSTSDCMTCLKKGCTWCDYSKDFCYSKSYACDFFGGSLISKIGDCPGYATTTTITTTRANAAQYCGYLGDCKSCSQSGGCEWCENGFFGLINKCVGKCNFWNCPFGTCKNSC